MRKHFLHTLVVATFMFAVCFPYLHVFSHHHHTKENHLTKSLNISVEENEDCLICNFDIATFLASEILLFSSLKNFYNNNYFFSIQENLNLLCFSFKLLRAPPSL